MISRILITLIIILTFGCKGNDNTEEILSTPSITVLKFLNAEGFADIEGAKKFYDVNTAFKQNSKPLNLPKNLKMYDGLDTLGKNSDQFGWEWHLKFFHENAITNGNTSSHFDIYNCNITEKIDGEIAIVKVIPNNKKSFMRVFELEKRKDKWMIIKIDFIKN